MSKPKSLSTFRPSCTSVIFCAKTCGNILRIKGTLYMTVFKRFFFKDKKPYLDKPEKYNAANGLKSFTEYPEVSVE